MILYCFELFEVKIIKQVNYQTITLYTFFIPLSIVISLCGNISKKIMLNYNILLYSISGIFSL